MNYLILGLLVVVIVLLILVLLKKDKDKGNENAELILKIAELSNKFILTDEKISNVDKNIAEKFGIFADNNYRANKQLSEMLTSQLSAYDKRFHNFTVEMSEQMKNIQETLQKRLVSLQNDNNAKLDEMRKIVDEKLQDTLNKRMNESFKLVNERLEQVYKGLGEMQNLAQGVGDLKKVLTNVKSRGILGEIQLGAILQEILSPEQYETNVATVQNSKNVVEFAVKLPTDDGGFIYMPIDSKFPGDSYRNLQDAYELGDKEAVDAAAKILIATIKSEAKDIRTKYIDPPNTTDFAIMFLPFEGLYAEAVNRGLVEILQNEFHVNIAGPSTMAALLNSLQMGFRAFAIQKRSGEVWKVLSAVKTEFDKFENVINLTQNRLRQANDELEKLVGTRTRQIQRSLKNVASLSEEDSLKMLENNE